MLQVELYLTHWWRCNGICQTKKPHFGIIRRSSNRAPGPNDFWWETHIRRCGGTFIKIKEPTKKPQSKNSIPMSKYDITNYVTISSKINTKNINTAIKNVNTAIKKSNSSHTFNIPKRDPVLKPQYKQPPVLFEGNGQTLVGGQAITNSSNVVGEVRNIWSKKQLDVTCTPDKKNQVAEVVRNVWTKKQLPVASILDKNMNIKEEIDTTCQCRKSPPAKVKKIDDYFKATSVLKDLYGGNIKITKSTNESQKLIAVSDKSIPPATDIKAPDDKNAVDIIRPVNCPICNALVSSQEINKHLDECLNKEVIDTICNETRKESASSRVLISTGQSNNKNICAAPSVPVLQIKKEFNEGIKSEIPLHNVGDARSLVDVKDKIQNLSNNVEPGPSRDNKMITKCVCCGDAIDKPLGQHLEECLKFFGNNTTIPEEGASTSSAIETIVIDDDIFDESIVLNATGTKVPCPCCLKMVEEAKMNEHLDMCLS